MSGTPRPGSPAAPPPTARRFSDPGEKPATTIGPGTRIKGEIVAGGGLDFAGVLEGPCRVEGFCLVREGARIVGDLTATSVVIEGEVSGETVVAEKVEIGTAARVRANVRAAVVAIAEGAFFDGEVHMEGRQGPAAPVAFKEKRKAERRGDRENEDETIG